jgi:nitric oxide synthase-interacting protein
LLSFALICFCLFSSLSGRIYEKEAILNYLVLKKKEIREQMTKYEKQTKDQINTEDVAAEESQKAAQIAFQKNDTGIIRGNNSDFRSSYQAKIASKGLDVEENDAKRVTLKRTSYWLSSFTPEHNALIIKPDERPNSPMSGEPLRMKDLVPLQLTLDEMDEKTGAQEKVRRR